MDSLRQRKKIARKERIQSAALSLFSEQGYLKTTISQIAREADLGTGTVYNYFKSKEEIIFSLIDEGLPENIDELDNIINSADSSIAESVYMFIDVYLKSFSFYNKTIWREVMGTAFLRNLPIMNQIEKVDGHFLEKLLALFNKFKGQGVLNKSIETRDIVKIIYDLLVLKITRFISDENLLLSDLKKSLEDRVNIIILMCTT